MFIFLISFKSLTTTDYHMGENMPPRMLTIFICEIH